jgi:hypothetical protein
MYPENNRTDENASDHSRKFDANSPNAGPIFHDTTISVRQLYL